MPDSKVLKANPGTAMKQQYAAYLPIKAEEGKIRETLETLQQKLYETNKPVAHRYTLTRSE